MKKNEFFFPRCVLVLFRVLVLCVSMFLFFVFFVLSFFVLFLLCFFFFQLGLTLFFQKGKGGKKIISVFNFQKIRG